MTDDIRREKLVKYITLNSIPRVRFAHVFGAEKYENSFLPAKDVIEITYISKGSFAFRAGGEERVIGEGGMLINTYTAPFFVEAKGRHEHHTVAFDVNFTLSDAPSPSAVPTFAGRVPESCLRLIDEIIRTNTLDSGGELKCAGLGLQLLHEMKRGGNSAQNPHITRAKKYIFDHIREPILQSQLAAALGITPEYLCAVFRRFEGSTVMGYVNRVKLESIRSLMARERLPLYAAAELFGYADPNYVSRLYKKTFGENVTESIKNGLR